jgi:hypothetical protein
LPNIHFVTYGGRHPSEYALPEAYSIAGSATRSTR